jgi:hypothetical protein
MHILFLAGLTAKSGATLEKPHGVIFLIYEVLGEDATHRRNSTPGNAPGRCATLDRGADQAVIYLKVN